MKTIHAIIEGRVQGVFFRDNTVKKAQEFSIRGWVRNKDNGTVEVEATGTPEHIDAFVEWLHQGPEQAQVDRVLLEQIELNEHVGFKILH